LDEETKLLNENNKQHFSLMDNHLFDEETEKAMIEKN
jgi:hypothetical protein